MHGMKCPRAAAMRAPESRRPVRRDLGRFRPTDQDWQGNVVTVELDVVPAAVNTNIVSKPTGDTLSLQVMAQRSWIFKPKEEMRKRPAASRISGGDLQIGPVEV
jgi:hypothetical protein